MQLFTAPSTESADGVNDADYEVSASYPTYGEAQQAIDRPAAVQASFTPLR